MQAFPNGSPRAPVAGALLIWIKAVNLKTLAMSPSLPNCMAQSPYCGTERDSFPVAARATGTRELEMVVENGCYTLKDTFMTPPFWAG